jgi:hypothetical protein
MEPDGSALMESDGSIKAKFMHLLYYLFLSKVVLLPLKTI